MSHFSHHIFFCLNERSDGRSSCGGAHTKQLQQYAKAQIKAKGLSGAGKVRINQAGCLDRCESGPCLVVYPQAQWYTFFDETDIDEIIEQAVVQGKAVPRLSIDKPTTP